MPDLIIPPFSIFKKRRFKSGKPVIRKSIHQDNKLSVLSKTPFLCKLRNVNVFIDRKQILFDINLDLRKNENWLITGENGSGKSTLLRLIAGQEFVAYGGKFQWFSDDGTHNGIDIKKRIALVSDLSQINYDFPVSGLELVLSGLDNSTGNYREYTQKEKAQAISLINEFFTRQAPEKIMQTSIRRLSTGQLRKLFLARAVIGQPDLLLLDEAFNGLDETSRGEVIALINDIANRGFMDHKPGIIMTSHYEDDRPDCINRIAIMENGKLSNDLTL